MYQLSSQAEQWKLGSLMVWIFCFSPLDQNFLRLGQDISVFEGSLMIYVNQGWKSLMVLVPNEWMYLCLNFFHRTHSCFSMHFTQPACVCPPCVHVCFKLKKPWLS